MPVPNGVGRATGGQLGGCARPATRRLADTSPRQRIALVFPPGRGYRCISFCMQGSESMKRNKPARSIANAIAALSLSAVAATASAALPGVTFASATIKNADGRIIGFASFTEDATGILHANVHVKGLSVGPHGVHIHAVGSCSHGATPFSGAGGHHNPLGHQHGLDNPLGAHAGDFPNLEVNAFRVGHLNDSTDRATLSPGPVSVFDENGSAIVIHASQDDQITDPTGNSGPRVACGVIEP